MKSGDFRRDFGQLTLEGAGHNNVLSNPHWARFANRLQGFLRECRAK